MTCGSLYNSVNARSLKPRASNRRLALFSFSSLSLDLRAGYIVRLISVLNFTYLDNSYLCCIRNFKTVFRKQITWQRCISGVWLQTSQPDHPPDFPSKIAVTADHQTFGKLGLTHFVLAIETDGHCLFFSRQKQRKRKKVKFKNDQRLGKKFDNSPNWGRS